LENKDRNNTVTFAPVTQNRNDTTKTINKGRLFEKKHHYRIHQQSFSRRYRLVDACPSIYNFSPYHFHRITKAFLGEPIGAFVTRLRVETAARLLRYGDMPIQNIAYRVGYNVPFSLSKAFKQFYGITLTEYKNNYCFFGNNIL